MPGLVKRFFVIALVLASACKDPVDQAAKKRIFSPEDPPQAVAAASQKLPPEEAADSVAISRRIFGMGAADRLKNLRTATRAEAEVELPGTALAVLDREKSVDAYYATIKGIRPGKSQHLASSANAGWAAGQKANVGGRAIGSQKSIDR